MAKDKKQVSWSDFMADEEEEIISTDDNLDVDDELDNDPDNGELEEPAPKDKKKIDKKQSKQKDEPLDSDEDPDDQNLNEGLDKDKKKTAPLKKVVEPDSKDEGEGEDEVDSSKFFEEVEKITGTTVDVDYGDIDPLTPQGIALRDKALKEATLDTFLEEIEQKFPQAFKALQHAYNGGDIAELFSQTTGRDYSKIEIKETDNDLAKEILAEYYKKRGVKSPVKISKMIEADEDSENGLIKEAQTALTELREEQENEKGEILERQKQKSAEQKKKDQILVASVDEVLETKRLGSFRITDRQEAGEFKKFILSSLRRTETGYELATPVNPAEMERQLQYAYFQFKKGDLAKIIQQKATTENTKKLSLRLQSEQSRSKRSTEQENRGSMSMRDFSEA